MSTAYARLSRPLSLSLLLAWCAVPAPAQRNEPSGSQGSREAQESKEDEQARLRRDQEEIVRKAERLRDLIVRLSERYQREGRTQQVALLQKGLLHLEQSKMLEDAASASHDLSTSALHEAVRKQTEVVADVMNLPEREDLGKASAILLSSPAIMQILTDYIEKVKL